MLLTDEEIDKAERDGAFSFKRHASSCRGQQVTELDNIQYHIYRAIERAVIAACEAKLREENEPVGHYCMDISKFEEGTQDYHSNPEWEPLFEHPAPIPEWQPIETAPKDGTRVLIKGDCTVVAGWQEITGMFGLMGWSIVNDAWMSSGEARYWMPLPKPPMAARSD